MKKLNFYKKENNSKKKKHKRPLWVIRRYRLRWLKILFKNNNFLFKKKLDLLYYYIKLNKKLLILYDNNLMGLNHNLEHKFFNAKKININSSLLYDYFLYNKKKINKNYIIKQNATLERKSAFWEEKWYWLVLRKFKKIRQKSRIPLKHNNNVETNSKIFAFTIISKEFLNANKFSVSKPTGFTYSINKFIRNFF